MPKNIISINKEIQIIDLCLYLKKYNALVISDIHIGYEEALNKQGILIPRLQFQQTMKRIENLINITLKADKQPRFDLIIINGDLKHEFGRISETEWRQTLKFLDFLSAKTEKIILIKGNHDTILEPIAKKRDIEIANEYALGNKGSDKDFEYYFCHGDKIPKTEAFKKSKTVIIGHEHPAIALKEDLRVEKFKCFLFGKYKSKNIIVLPSFNPVTEGTDVLKENLLSPFLKQDLSNFEVYVVPDSESVLYFKRIRDILKLN
ncbi:TPA: metallophosphoesterase [Candidatus Woesearchaeota archaeon]|nr:metallophosphoesterase [Candidatus Woesearchaeota archaeon]